MAKIRRKTEDATSAMATGVDRERVAMRAYELYMARGCAEGHDVDDWLSAERELSQSGAQAEAANDDGRNES